MKHHHHRLAALFLALGCSTDPAPAPTDAGNDVVRDVPDDLASDAPARPDVPRPADAARVVTLADIEERVFRPHCAIPSCHASAEPTGRMRLDEDFPRTSLRAVAAMGVSCGGQGFVRVVPGDPAASLLYRKITEDAPPCGSRMPQAADPLPAELTDLVRDWITAGAP